MNPDQRQATIEDFIDYCQGRLAIEVEPKIEFISDREWATTHRSFGAYDPATDHITVYIGNRNLADVLRTLGHELVHHRQRELGHIEDAKAGETGSPIENQANSLAGVIMRDYGKTNDLIYEAKEAKKNPAKYQIYCDMDGVLCDFDRQFETYFGISPEGYKEKFGKQKFYDSINEAGQKFWISMPWMPEGKVLWNKIKNYSPIIVTSPGFFEGAKEGKLVWIKSNLKPYPAAVKFEQAGEKQNVLAGKTPEEISKSVLIDDYDRNIEAWKAAGGKTIKEKPSKPAHNHLD